MQLDRHLTTPVPMIVAGITAAIGVAGFVFLFAAGAPDTQRHAEGMITASVIYHAGASMTPTQADTR
jgi:hypothetical protein